jgi:quinol monooxygenase YgiN
MQAMSKLALIITTRTKPGARDQVRKLYLEHLAPRAEANQAQEAVVLCFDGNDPHVLHLFEVYRDQDALHQAAQASWCAEYMGQAAPLLAGEPQVRMAIPVWETGLARQAPARRRLR